MIFSTDKAANPKSILGYFKRFAEKICEYFNTFKSKDFIKIVRFKCIWKLWFCNYKLLRSNQYGQTSKNNTYESFVL